MIVYFINHYFLYLCMHSTDNTVYMSGKPVPLSFNYLGVIYLVKFQTTNLPYI